MTINNWIVMLLVDIAYAVLVWFMIWYNIRAYWYANSQKGITKSNYKLDKKRKFRATILLFVVTVPVLAVYVVTVWESHAMNGVTWLEICNMAAAIFSGFILGVMRYYRT